MKINLVLQFCDQRSPEGWRALAAKYGRESRSSRLGPLLNNATMPILRVKHEKTQGCTLRKFTLDYKPILSDERRHDMISFMHYLSPATNCAALIQFRRDQYTIVDTARQCVFVNYTKIRYSHRIICWLQDEYVICSRISCVMSMGMKILKT